MGLYRHRDRVREEIPENLLTAVLEGFSKGSALFAIQMISGQETVFPGNQDSLLTAPLWGFFGECALLVMWLPLKLGFVDQEHQVNLLTTAVLLWELSSGSVLLAVLNPFGWAFVFL